MDMFKQQLKNSMEGKGNKQPTPPQQPQQPGQPIKVKKNLILSYPSDPTGCGHIRNIFPMMYLNSVYGKSGQLVPMVSPVFIWQQDVLAKTKAIYFQRQMSPEHLKIIKKYKELQPQLKYKMIWELDDFIWGHNELQGGDKEDGVPSYNFGWKNITDEVKESSVQIMKLMDKITVSTQWLADYIKNELKVDVPIVVLQNTVPKFFWGDVEKPDITEDIEKPKVLYTGSPTHYSNKDKLKGDFDNAWCDWVIKNVNEDKIDFTVMGGSLGEMFAKKIEFSSSL